MDNGQYDEKDTESPKQQNKLWPPFEKDLSNPGRLSAERAQRLNALAKSGPQVIGNENCQQRICLV